VLSRHIWLAILAAVPAITSGQQAEQNPPVKVNILNVCTPSAEEQKEIASALASVPKQPLFSPDFEVARGRSSLPGQGGAGDEGGNAQPLTAAWVRMRHEFSQGVFSNVQYSFSADSKNMIETLVLHVRDPKNLVLVSIEDTASSVTSPAAMLGTNTPIDRIKLERFGKPSVVLARCAASQAGPPPDQSAYEPLFRDAAAVLGKYRELLRARRTVPEELAKVVTSPGTKPQVPAKKKPVEKK
jgi:hypothetical protein